MNHEPESITLYRRFFGLTKGVRLYGATLEFKAKERVGFPERHGCSIALSLVSESSRGSSTCAEIGVTITFVRSAQSVFLRPEIWQDFSYSSTVEARLLRFWVAKNVKRRGELMWLNMLMVDVNCITGNFSLTTKVEPFTIAELDSFVNMPLSQLLDSTQIKDGVMLLALNAARNFSPLNLPLHVCDATILMLLVLRCIYRVEFAIADDTAESVFVCFDGVLTKLHNLEAREVVQMLAEEGVNLEDSLMLLFITDMEGKTYTFHVKLTTYNLTACYQSFAMTRILDDRERLPLPEFVDNGGGDNDGVDMAVDKPIPAKVESGGSSGEAALTASTELNSSVPSELAVVKKTQMA
ncbi:hypothetical protein Bca101_009951 [Brassica carinata]